MKIAITELESKEVLKDISSATAGEIVGGVTAASVEVKAEALGDVAITRSDADVYSFNYQSNRGKYSFSFAFGYAFGFSFEEN